MSTYHSTHIFILHGLTVLGTKNSLLQVNLIISLGALVWETCKAVTKSDIKTLITDQAVDM